MPPKPSTAILEKRKSPQKASPNNWNKAKLYTTQYNNHSNNNNNNENSCSNNNNNNNIINTTQETTINSGSSENILRKIQSNHKYNILSSNSNNNSRGSPKTSGHQTFKNSDTKKTKTFNNFVNSGLADESMDTKNSVKKQLYDKLNQKNQQILLGKTNKYYNKLQNNNSKFSSIISKDPSIELNQDDYDDNEGKSASMIRFKKFIKTCNNFNKSRSQLQKVAQQQQQEFKLKDSSRQQGFFSHRNNKITENSTNSRGSVNGTGGKRYYKDFKGSNKRQTLETNKIQIGIQDPTISNNRPQTTEPALSKEFGNSQVYSGGVANLERYEFGPVLGQGSYAIVHYARDKQTNRQVAVKTYDKFKLMDPQRRNNVKREISNLQRLKHPNIIKLYMTVDTRISVNLIMEYVGNMSLRHILKAKPERKLEEKEAKLLFKQLMQALKYCHDNYLAHRDIKLENILVDKNKKLKLIDFGFSVRVYDDKKLNVFCGTPSYMPPEIILKKEYIGKYADIWSCGVLLYVLLLGKFPFKGKDDKDLYKKIVKCEYFINPQEISSEAQDLIKQLLIYHPTQRLSAKQILEHDWLKV